MTKLTGLTAYTQWAIAHPWHVSGAEPRPPVPDDCDCGCQRRAMLQHIDDLEDINAALLAALEELRHQLRNHIKLDVKKHYSLMVADAAAGTAIAKAKD